MSEFDQMYREVILDHYKNPRGHGELEDADAHADGQNPLCGDEVSIYVAFAEDGETIDEVKFSGRGCAISQAATSMLTEMVQGKTATAVATLDKQELLDEIGIPLSPVRLKCAMLGLTTLKVALHKAKGTPLPDGLAGFDELELHLANGHRDRRRSGGRVPAGLVQARRRGAGRVRRRLQLRRPAVRDRGPLLARRRPALRGRVGRRDCAASSARAMAPPSISRPAGRSRCPAFEPVETYPVEIVDGTSGSRRVSRFAAGRTSDPLYVAYHDEEWGRPGRDERGLYERLCLEGFQSGLSWLTILRKRENFRRAFADFDPEVVARFGERDVERLLGDAGIVRHRGKIEATIANAHGVLALRKAGTPLHELVWSFAPSGYAAPRTTADWHAQTDESKELSKRLKTAGFRFVGPTTVWAAHAGLRRRQRPPRDLLCPRRGRARTSSSSQLNRASPRPTCADAARPGTNPPVRRRRTPPSGKAQRSGAVRGTTASSAPTGASAARSPS